MRALITGINGHVGSHLARILLREGWNVSGLVRPAGNLTPLAGLPLDLHYGDIASKTRLLYALRNCDACFHLAAPTVVRTHLDHVSVMLGIRHLCELMGKLRQVKRMVYVSSTVTVGVVDSTTKTLDERSYTKLSGTPYHALKWDAETYVRGVLARHHADIVIVNPSSIVGPGDVRPTPMGQMIVDFLNYAGGCSWMSHRCYKAAPVWFQTGFSLVDVEDVAQGIYRAFTSGRAGERYILSGDNIEMRRMHLVLSAMTGFPPPFLYVPKSAMRASAWALTKLMEHPPMSYALAKTMVGTFAFFTQKKAAQELGYTWRPYTQSLFRAVEWFLKTPFIYEHRKPKIARALKQYKNS